MSRGGGGGSGLSSVFYAETYHPIQAGSIDGTDILPHDNGLYRATLCSNAALCNHSYFAATDTIYWWMTVRGCSIEMKSCCLILQMTPLATQKLLGTLIALSSSLVSLISPPKTLFIRYTFIYIYICVCNFLLFVYLCNLPCFFFDLIRLWANMGWSKTCVWWGI